MLNETARMIWSYCNGKNDVAKIANFVSAETKSLISEELVELCIEQLKEENLLEDNSLKTGLTGISRREAVKRVGFSIAVALPLVSSIVAPKALMAQSMLAANDQA